MFYFFLLLVGSGAFVDTLSQDSNFDLDNTLSSFSPLSGEESGSNGLLDDDTLLTYNIEEVEPDEPLSFDSANLEANLDIPLEDDWLSNSSSSSDIFGEAGSIPEMPIPEEDINESNISQQISSINEIALDFCPWNSSPASKRRRKMRKREEEGFCASDEEQPADIILQVPAEGDISQELLRQKYCSQSQWPTFGNLPVCVKMDREAVPMSSWVLGSFGRLRFPLNGWMSVPGELYIYDNTCKSGLVYCCNAFVPHLLQYPKTLYSPPKGWGYWCVPGFLRLGKGGP